MAKREIIIDITKLKDGKRVMDFYQECVRKIIGEEEIKQVNISEFSEYAGYNLPVDVVDMCYYVKFVKGQEYITFVIDSGTLFLEGFRIMDGLFYLLGNNNLDIYEQAVVQVKTGDAMPLQPRLLQSLQKYNFTFENLVEY